VEYDALRSDRHHRIIEFGFPNLMAKEGEIAVPVFEKPVPHFKPGKELRECVEPSAKHTPLQPVALGIAE
jgi:hypothetical protein